MVDTKKLMNRAVVGSIVISTALVIMKLTAWSLSDSVSLLSSMIDSIVDVGVAVINLVAVRIAFVPADDNHSYGHGKIEPLASLIQAAFIAGSSVFLLIESIQHLISPPMITNTGIGMVMMVVSIILLLGMTWYQARVVRKTQSLLVGSDRVHYLSDLILAFGVIGSLALSRMGWVVVDPLFGIFVFGWMLYGSWQIGKGAISHLMDEEISEKDRSKIKEIALSQAGVLDIHDLRTRASGPNQFIQIHLELVGSMSLQSAHEIADQVEAAIIQAYPNSEVLIHQDPI